MTLESGDEVVCGTCGSPSVIDENGHAVCYGNTSYGKHSRSVLAKPCGVCGDPIRSAEICSDCAQKPEQQADDDCPRCGGTGKVTKMVMGRSGLVACDCRKVNGEIQ